MLGAESTKIIKFGTKVGEQKIDEILNSFCRYFTKDTEKDNNYKFDFSDVEWIDNQGILVVTGLLKYLVELEVPFKFNFLKDGSSEFTDKRKAKQFVEVWEIWKIYQISPNLQYDKYFDIDGNFIEGLKKRFKIKIANQEIYDRYGVTPFLALNKIEKYEDRKIGEMLSNIYKLNDATNDILIKNDCYLPFENETISSIITKELYENFLDHFKNSIFINKNDYAFMSLSLKRKMNATKDKGKVQFVLKQNFEEESIPELKDFYYNSSKSEYKNQSLLQISFLDFGQGIPNTLSESYGNSTNKSFSSDLTSRNLDTKILEYAFMPNSSQHKVYERYLSAFIVPRGLFDLISIVKRFEGLLVARSNHGKIAFDFSENKSFSNSIRNFGDNKNFFPGTLISIYIPERNLQNKFDYSSIKPSVEEPIFNFKTNNNKYISLFEIQKKLKTSYSLKEDVYNNLFKNLVNEFTDSQEFLIYVDFKGYEIDERITKKIIYFLCSDYGINSSKNIIVINPPPVQFLENIKDEIANLSSIEKKFTLHPTPFVSINLNKDNLEIFWLGVYSDRDIEKLNTLLYESHNLSYVDFENPDDVVGHINKYDKHGNLISIINSSQIINFYKEKILQSRNHELETLISPNIKKEEGSIFLCNGNYYQYEYLQLFDILNNKDTLDYLSNELFQELTNTIDEIESYIFIGITASSHKILQSFINNNQILSNKCVLLNNYFSFEKEDKFENSISHGDKIILICDVISTGFMVEKLETQLNNLGATLYRIGVLIDAIDQQFDDKDYSKIKDKLTTIYPYKLEKLKRNDISSLLHKKKLKVIRINPFTNTPITQSISDTNYTNSVLLENNEFIELLDPKDIHVGYFSFNNLIHPYFFDMSNILKDSQSSQNLLKTLFFKLNEKESLKELDVIFYPKDSGIKNLNFDYLKNDVLKNQYVDFHELERFSTDDGWKFSHPPQYLIDKYQSKTSLILDDGSCSGESIIQMIDEVAFLGVKKIYVLSIIGRVSEHKREFLSRINSISNSQDNIEIKIFFGSHWHIPTYYNSKSPVTSERHSLNNLLQFPNTPQNIKSIASLVLDEIKAKDISEGNNTYLIKSRSGDDVFQELIILRNEIGKLTEFRFYKEYFSEFDDFISLYESRSSSIRGEFPYQFVEIFCGVLIHEPYLFEKIKMVVPDIVDKIKEFVIKLFWTDTIVNRDQLYYLWNNKNLFHLIFIVFKNKELFDILNVENFMDLINKYVKSNSDLNYILFKLSFYLPIQHSNNQRFDYSGRLKLLINKLIEKGTIEEDHTRILKRFRSFSNSLLSSNDYDSNLAKVKHNYAKITDDKYHNDAISAHIDTLLVQLDVIAQEYKTEVEKSIIKAWDSISPFIDALLNLSNAHPEFFLPFGSSLIAEMETNEKSLRNQYGLLSDMIYELNATSNFEEIKNLANGISNNFISSDSYVYKIFHNIITNDFLSEFGNFKKSIENEYPTAVIYVNEYENIGLNIDIPKRLLLDGIFDQIAKNFRHADLSSPILLELDINFISTIITLKIENKCLSSKFSEHGGGSGLQQLNDLNTFPGSLVNYKYSNETGVFIQEISLKKI